MPKERILIADDEPDVLSLCMRIIRSDGYEVTGVSSGLEAIEQARKEHFDLFLTDIMMPGIKGLETAQAIRQVQPECVFVVMTGFGTMDTAIQALKLGFSEFVVKPFKPQDLKLAINRALEKERLRSENERLNALIPLFELNKKMMSTVEEAELASQVLRTTCSELGADRGLLMLLDRELRQLNVGAVFSIDDTMLPAGAVEQVLHMSRTLLDARGQVLVQKPEEARPELAEVMALFEAKSLLFNPLLAMDVPVGALVLFKSEDNSRFAPGDSELLSVLCGQAAVALQNAGLFEEIQRAYKELQKLDHMKSEFINIAAHELRTPLAILMGHADLLVSDVDDPDIKDRLMIIVRNSLRLRGLIDALLDMRHLQTGEARVKPSLFSVQDLIDEMFEDLGPTAAAKNIQIAVQVDGGLTPVLSDRDKTQSALTNLVNNALRFTPAGGRVGIEASQHGEEIWVSVWDTGVGIPVEEFENIFRPFYQVEESLTREHEGMGLGLSIAKGMVELCGGRIWVESELSRGSRFTFSIPC